ncbi:hypothetical protein DRQ26_03350 [bacterium]|nr:MAG: hypothetical protein DRQ26_03350 [bacterium]
MVAVRALRNKGTADFGKLQLELIRKLDERKISREEAQKRVEEFWIGRLRDAVVNGDVSYGSLMAGQSVGLVDREMSVAEIIEKLASEAEKELIRVQKSYCG